jgi:hypothetical protein
LGVPDDLSFSGSGCDLFGNSDHSVLSTHDKHKVVTNTSTSDIIDPSVSKPAAKETTEVQDSIIIQATDNVQEGVTSMIQTLLTTPVP